MKLADNIKKLIRDLHVLDVDTSDEMDQRIVHDAMMAQQKLKETKSAETGPDIWRRIMKSPYTKYGTIAATPLIVVIFLLSIWVIPTNNILLADVQRKVLEQKTCLITGTRVLTTKDKEPEITRLTVHKYLSFEYGYLDQTFDETGKLLISVAVHHPSKTATVLLPQMKRYIQVPFPKEYEEKMKGITMLKLFGLLMYNGDSKDLEKIDFDTFDITKLKDVKKAEVQGVEAVGFEVFDLPNKISHKLGFKGVPLMLDMQESRICTWINPKTLLPIEMEAEIDLGKCILTNFKEMKLNEVNDGFEWNVEMDESLFSPAIPEDYQIFGVPEIKGTAVIGTSGAVVAIPLAFWIKKRRGMN